MSGCADAGNNRQPLIGPLPASPNRGFLGGWGGCEVGGGVSIVMLGILREDMPSLSLMTLKTYGSTNASRNDEK